MYPGCGPGLAASLGRSLLDDVPTRSRIDDIASEADHGVLLALGLEPEIGPVDRTGLRSISRQLEAQASDLTSMAATGIQEAEIVLVGIEDLEAVLASAGDDRERLRQRPLLASHRWRRVEWHRDCRLLRSEDAQHHLTIGRRLLGKRPGQVVVLRHLALKKRIHALRDLGVVVEPHLREGGEDILVCTGLDRDLVGLLQPIGEDLRHMHRDLLPVNVAGAVQAHAVPIALVHPLPVVLRDLNDERREERFAILLHQELATDAGVGNRIDLEVLDVGSEATVTGTDQTSADAAR